MQTLRSSATVIITRPSEVIACAKISESGLDVFVIFDIYPRPSYPSSPCLILSTSIDQTVLRLVSALHVIDEFFLSEGDSQSQASCPNVSSRLFVSNGPLDVRQSGIESGLTILKLQAETAGLTQGKAILERDLERFLGVLSAQLARDRFERAEEGRDVASSMELELQHSVENDPAAASTSRNFSCAICLDEHPVDNNVDLDCDHAICRDCTRGHVSAKIEEHRFPVLCPVCMTERNDRPGGMYIRYLLLLPCNNVPS